MRGEPAYTCGELQGLSAVKFHRDPPQASTPSESKKVLVN
jgi:hypothetical protein